jgi:HSP20 family protein
MLAGKGIKMKLLSKWNSQSRRWDPFRNLADFEKRLERAFTRTPLLPSEGGESFSLAEWEPLTDISEDDKEFLVKIELPAMKKDDVKVTLENGVLRISGERKEEKEEKNKKYHRLERSYGSFVRAFSLPSVVDGTRIKADYHEGVLSIHLPKTEEAKSKAIEVTVA